MKDSRPLELEIERLKAKIHELQRDVDLYRRQYREALEGIGAPKKKTAKRSSE